MKKVIASVLCFAMCAGLMAGCKDDETTTATSGDATTTTTEAATSQDGSSEVAPTDTEAPASSEELKDSDPHPGSYGNGDIHVLLYAMSAEVPKMVKQYFDQTPDMAAKYTVDYMYCNNDNQGYEMKVNAALLAGEGTAPDLYVAEADYILPYTQGEFSQYAATYEELIGGVDAKVKDAEIAEYTVTLGTNTDGNLVALCYQCTGGAFIYRRSIAKEVFGSDDQATVEAAIGAGTGNWDKFLDAAAKLKEKNYAIISGLSDLYQVSEKASTTPWVVDGKFNIDPQREAFIDLAKTVIDNGYSNDTSSWGSAWYGDMADEGATKVFGWFGPCWLINYVIADYIKPEGATWGDYAVCVPPMGFWWGGSWLLCNKDVIGTDKQEFCAKFVEWVTLDTSDTSLQYGWANGTFEMCAAKDTVASAKIMATADGTMEFLGGQNPFQIFVDATAYASSKCKCAYDSDLNGAFQDNVALYAKGDIASKEELMAKMYDICEDKGIDVDA